MTSIAILGDSLRTLCIGHHILDVAPEAEISIITDRAEIGLIGEVPGMVSSWPPCPLHWISEMSTQTPASSSTAVRGSWLLKAMGIQLSKRGCTFLLRTRVTSSSSNEVRFVGGGPMGSGVIHADHILDLRNTSQESKRWYGFVCRTEDSPESAVSGDRTDGTSEIWAQEKPEPTGNFLQEMTWTGAHPADHISGEVQSGIQLAQTIVDTIIHPVEQ